MKKVVIAGATGLVGAAAVKHFTQQPDCTVIALARRSPEAFAGSCEYVAVDLNDATACKALAEAHPDVTHLVYAAVQEQPDLITGWRDSEQIETNDRMFRNLLDPIIAVGTSLRHVSILQGTKAYGVHVGAVEIPARENRSELRSQPNFYWRQEDYLRERQRGQDWHWTIFRPVHIFGQAIGSSLNPIAAIGAYAAILKEQGRPLDFPGGPVRISEAIDVDVLARSIAWGGEAETARNQVFNVTNGDVFTWRDVWPAIADAVGMKVGTHVPTSLGQTMPNYTDTWDKIRSRHNLAAPSLDAFVGRSFQFADYSMRYGLERTDHVLVSTVKLRQAGFHEVIDTEAMLRKWFRSYQNSRLLPQPS